MGGNLPANEQFDLLVIGCGPAGEKAAAQAAYFGKRVAVIERAAQVGGTCINTGTVPSKTLRESALYFSGLKQRGLYGIDYSLKENLTVHDFMHHEREVVEMERQRILQNLAQHRVTLVRGQAAFEDAHTVTVADNAGKNEQRRLTAQTILIATGSKPHRPAEIAFDDVHTFDSDTFLQMQRIPQSLAVIGGGVIGCEYASIFMALGVEVTLIDGRNRLLPFLDAEIAEHLRKRLQSLGMKFWFGERPAQAENFSGGVRLRMKSAKTMEAEAALFAAGRRAAVDGLALEKAGLALGESGYITVDENYRTAVPSIYAAGDVIGFPALASTSMEQGRVAVCHAFGFKYKQRVASMLPMGIYTIPEISAAGETEESCKDKKIDYCVGRARYANNARGHIAGDTTGMLKLIFAPADMKLLGVSMIGENATELIHIGMMVLDNGLSINEFIEQVFNYPTLSETYKYAAYDGLGNLAGHKLREGCWGAGLRRRRVPRAFRKRRTLAAIAALGFLFAPSRGLPAQVAHKHAHPSQSHLGFDLNDYPGDAALPVLRKTFAYAGYWLSPAPRETENTWLGKRSLLRAQGFGFLVLFAGPNSRELSASNADALGKSTAQRAAAAARAEGFPRNTIIFIDIEEGGRLPAAYHAYLRAFADELAAAGYRTGVYCSGMRVSEGHGVTIVTADDIRANEAPRTFTYWVYNDKCPPSPGCSFSRQPLPPSASGVPYASVWQTAQSPRRKNFAAHCAARYDRDGNCYVPGDSAHAWHLDVNTATSPDPSHGRGEEPVTR